MVLPFAYISYGTGTKLFAKGWYFMNNYVIVTDSGSDLSESERKNLGITSLPLSVTMDGDEREDYAFSPNEFYKLMRGGAVAKTSAVNYQSFLDKFRSIASRGYDALYIGLSSGISSTYASAKAAADRIKKEMPERNIIALDSKCASAGLGLLVHLIAKKKSEGIELNEAFEYAHSLAPKICHQFTVDDLAYLRRGGRISAASAFFGNALGIKPLFHVDNGGFLKATDKARGRRAAIESLADSFITHGGERHSEDIFISHADSKRDAELLSDTLFERYGRRAKTFDIGAVIGAHAGPGTLALFFIGDMR